MARAQRPHGGRGVEDGAGTMTLPIWIAVYLLSVAGAAYLWYRLCRPGREYERGLERDDRPSGGPWSEPTRVRVDQDRMQGL